MKFILKLFLIVVVALAGLLLAAQVLINRRLNPEIQKALPAISSESGLDIRLGGAAVNLFVGIASANALAIHTPGNTNLPPLVSVDRASVSLGWLHLFQKVLYIKNISVDNAVFTLVRTADGGLRLPTLPPATPDTEDPAATEPPAPETGTEPAAPAGDSHMPKIAIKRADISSRLVYEDRMDRDQPARVVLDIRLGAEDVYTYGDLPEEDWGVVRLQGHSSSHPDVFKIDILARVAPAMNPATASLTIEGSILNVNLKELGTLAKDLDVTSESADATVQLKILEGEFQKGSSVTLTLRKAELTGELKKKYKRIVLPETVSLLIPVKGTLESPAINVAQAVTHSLLKNIADNPDYLLDQITIDGKSLRDRMKKGKRD